MQSALGYSTYEDDKDKTKSGQRKHNTTYKKKSKKASVFIKSLPLPKEDEGDSDDEFGVDYSSENNTGSSIKPSSIEPSILQEGLDQRKKYDAEQKDYSNQYVPSYIGTQQNVPYYSQLLNSNSLQSSNESDLMKKLNYVVHLLEEQHDEKTGSVTEELVLYMFLGVFVIFIVDSFSRTSKYKR